MDFKTVGLDGFYLVGVTVRTTNANNQAQADISVLWERIFTEDWAGKIPNKLSNDMYSAYINYQSDYTAPYTYLLGFKVSSLDAIPEGFTAHTVEPSSYHVYTAKGKIPYCIHDTWMHIWHNETERSYKADFEIFSANTNPENAEVEIYIGIRD